jgi:hypothetical protein
MGRAISCGNLEDTIYDQPLGGGSGAGFGNPDSLGFTADDGDGGGLGPFTMVTVGLTDPSCDWGLPTPICPTIQVTVWAGYPASRASGNSSWAWTFTKTFVSNLVSPTFYKQELGEGGCLNTFLEGVDQADVLGPVLNGSPGFAETAVKGQTATLAARYAANQGLTVPLRSSVVRGILEKGETGAGAFAIGYFDVQAATGVFKETQAALAGTCH